MLTMVAMIIRYIDRSEVDSLFLTPDPDRRLDFHFEL